MMCLCQCAPAGLKTAVVSNFDVRLRRILSELGIEHLFDAVIVSGGWLGGGLCLCASGGLAELI